MTSCERVAKHCVMNRNMSLSLSCIRLLFLVVLINPILGISEDANSSVEWTKVSLNKEDARGASVLIALIRNAEKFSLWIKGRELKGKTYIGILRRANAVRSEGVDLKDGTHLQITKSTTKFVIYEELEPQLNRLSITNEILETTVRTKKNLSLRKTYVDGVEVPLPDTVVSHSLNYKYPSADVSASLESAPNREYVSLFKELEKSKEDCLEQSPGAMFCKVSGVTVDLVRAVSRHAALLAQEIKTEKEKGNFELDTSAPKSVTFERNADGSKIRRVEVSGLIRKKNEVFETDDGRSSWVIRFDNDAVPKIVQRGDFSATQKNDFNSNTTWGIK